jgi:hypothetical protein
MAALANPQLAALMQALQARGGAPGAVPPGGPAIPPAGVPPVPLGGPAGAPATGMGASAIPPGWQAALAQIAQARAGQGGLGPLAPPDAVSGITGQQGALSPAAIQAAGGILAGRRPRLSR